MRCQEEGNNGGGGEEKEGGGGLLCCPCQGAWAVGQTWKLRFVTPLHCQRSSSSLSWIVGPTLLDILQIWPVRPDCYIIFCVKFKMSA